MPLDDSQIRDLEARLTGASESDRLKACDVVAKLNVPPDREAARRLLPVLKDVFLADANPAVKFLAKRALVNLGEDPEKIRAMALRSAGQEVPDEFTQLTRDAPVLWRCAQEELRPCLALLPRLITSTDDSTGAQVSAALEKCGTAVASVPLLVAFQEERQSPTWQEREAQAVELYTDVQELIELMKVQASAINPVLAAQMGNLRRPEVLAAFIDMLRSQNLLLREGAVRVLADLADSRTVDPLLRLLGAGSADFDMEVIRTLSKIARADPAAQVPVLKKVLGHFRPGESDQKLASIVDAVGRISNPRTIDFVRGCLKHPLPRVRANAVEALCALGIQGEDRVRAIFPLFKDENNRVLANAIVALWGTSAQPYARARIDRMAADADRWMRASLAFALGLLNTPEVSDVFVRLLADPNEDVRRNAVKSLRRITNAAVIEAAVRHLTHPDPSVRVYIIEAIGRHGLTQYNQALTVLLEDPQADTRIISATVLALGRIKNMGNLPVLTPFLRHADERVRANTVEAVEALGDAKLTALLQKSILDAHPRTRANACKALWKYGDLWVVDTVKGMIESPLPRFRSSGAYVLGEMAGMTRVDAQLRQLPLLVAALRRHAKFAEFRNVLAAS